VCSEETKAAREIRAIVTFVDPALGLAAFFFEMPEELTDVWRQHMRHGDFEAAWRISDRALQSAAACSRVHLGQESTWRGEPLDGKNVLIRCCYGLGDTLQFVRYVPLLRRVARILRI
jgi:hypothetical protein